MKKINEFILRKVANEYILIPIGSTTETINGIITLTETGAFIYNHIEEADSLDALVQMIISEYEVEYDEAYQDAIAFINQMLRVQIIALSDAEKNW